MDPDLDPDAATILLPEWDYEIQDYKPDWVRLKEHVLQPGSRDFVDEVMKEHGASIHWLRRRFEALRPQALKRVRGMVDGDFLDMDRVVDARVTRRAGGSPSERLYGRHLRNRRDVAVAFVLDMSSSTNEVASEGGQRIIEVEKQALVLISEAIDALGDACAIYGFSGYGRGHVAFYVAKDFQDPWDDQVRARIGRMSWKMENRDGAAIRHAAERLRRQPARVRLMILLSDGKPLDCGCDHYYDRYAQEDTRMALQEARALGVHPFCITVDPRGQDYLAEMYGEVGYLVIDRVEKLPEQLPLIYRRLTR
jgi:nitric oxide reductase activation protein